MYIQEILDSSNYRFRYACPDKKQTFPMHFHDGYELLYIKSGGGNCFIEGERYSFFAGDMIVTAPNEAHSINMNANSERWQISFRPIYLSEFIDSEFNPLTVLQSKKIGTQNHIAAATAEAHGLNISMNNIKELCMRDAAGKETLIKANLLVILNELAAIFPKNEMKPSKYRLTDIVAYINKHFTEEIIIEALAKEFFISKSQLSHMFSASMGIPLKSYITHKRIIYAKELIASNQPLLDIALQAGFNDYSIFYRAFKNVTDMTPSEYRKKFI